MKSVLVTGANGFLGANLVEVLAGRGYRVLAGVHTPVPPILKQKVKQLEGHVSWHQLDVTQPEDWRALPVSPDGMIHAAAVTPVDERDPLGTVEVNLMGTLNGLEYALAQDIKRFIALSSASVYRDVPDGEGPLTETEPVRPIHSYGISKVAAESFVTLYRQQKGLDGCSVRMTGIYGPWERPTDARKGMSPVYQLLLAVVRGQRLRVYDAGGSGDYMHAREAARALVHLLECEKLEYDVINLSTGVSISSKRLLEAVGQVAPEAPIEWVADAHKDDADLILGPTRKGRRLSVERLAKQGFVSNLALEAGLSDYLDWLSVPEHRELIEGSSA